MVQKLSCVVMLTAGLMAAAPVAASLEHARDFDLTRQPIAKALNRFAKQAGISIARPRLSYRDGRAQALTGSFTLEEALSKLLEGTDFGFEIISQRAVRIFKKKAEKKTTDAVHVSTAYVPIEEIIVSSTRRLDAVQKLPYSISAITGSQQEHLRAINTSDIIHRLAGVYSTKRGEGQNKIIIRGMSDGAFAGRAQSLVSTYFDNTRATYNAPDPSLRLYDIERVEILRGPQGTLYGSGAIGGLYKVITRKPAFGEVELNATAGFGWTEGGEASEEFSVTLNLPLFGNKAAMRWVGYYEGQGGYIDDIRLNETDVNDNQSWGGRGALALRVTDNLTLTFGTNLQKHKADDSNYFNGDHQYLERDNFLAEPREDSFTQFYGTLEASTSWGEVVSSSSWAKRDIAQTLDGTLATQWLVGLEGDYPAPFQSVQDIKTFTNETHISSNPGGRIEWMLGAFYANRQELSETSLQVEGVRFIVGDSLTETIYRELWDNNVNELALFGEVSYFLNEKLSVTGGLRWFRYDDKALSELVDIGLGVNSGATGRQKKDGFTPKFVVSYQANDDLLLYAQVSEGYRVGGINAAGLSRVVVIDNNNSLSSADSTEPIVVDPDQQAKRKARKISPTNPPSQAIELGIVDVSTLHNFNSDTLTNYEIGLKSKLLGGRLTANLSGYYADWQSIQSHQYFEGLPDVDNVGNARVVGGELDLNFFVTPDFEIQAHVSISDSELTRTANRFFAAVGDKLPGAPKYSTGASVRYEFDFADNLRASVSADHSYVSGTNLLFNTAITPRNSGYHRANVRFAIAGHNWQLTAYVDNLLDTKVNVFAFGNPLALAEFETFATTKQYTPLRPRTVGFEISYRY